MSPVVLNAQTLPDSHTAVELIYDQSFGHKSTVFHTRLIPSRGNRVMLDALHDHDGKVISAPRGRATMQWRDARGGLWSVPVRVEQVLKPIHSVAIRFLAQPTVTQTRHEPRYDAHPRGRFIVHWPDFGLQAYATVARNASRAGVRCFAPILLEPPRLVHVEWTLDDIGLIEGTMRFIATRAEHTQWRDKHGHDVVALWEPKLTDIDAARWLRYLQRFPQE